MFSSRVAQLFNNLPKNYPRRLKREHAHVLNRLMELWGTPQFESYLYELLIAKRGKRHGFSLGVVAEIMFINELHNIYSKEGYRLPENVDASPKVEESWEVIQVANPTPEGFYQSIEHGQLDVLNTFIKGYISVDHRFEESETPLIIAVINGQLETVRYLITHGAYLDLFDSGKYTALHWAAYYHHCQIITELIEAGASINATQNSGDTPLSLAVIRGHQDAAKLLLEHHADPNIAGNDGLPLLIALRKNHLGMIKLLKQFGAHA